MQKKTINGKEIEYGDCIHHTTTSYLSFWDKIKILFGQPITISSEIYCKNEAVNTIISTAEAFVPTFRIFRKKQKGGLYSGEFTEKTAGE